LVLICFDVVVVVCCVCQSHPGAPHLLVLNLQTNEDAAVAELEKYTLLRVGYRQVVAGLPSYDIASLVGKTVVLLANIKPFKVKEVHSEAVLLTAVKGKTIGLLVPEQAAGAVQPQGDSLVVPRDCVATFKPNFDCKKLLPKIDLITRGDDGAACFGSSEFVVQVEGKPVRIVADNKLGEGAKVHQA
jgi:tRNA-binding EMAP/Myf-like protein